MGARLIAESLLVLLRTLFILVPDAVIRRRA